MAIPDVDVQQSGEAVLQGRVERLMIARGTRERIATASGREKDGAS
jgi:hypothetical protein